MGGSLNRNPRLSLVTPAYNEESGIRTALEAFAGTLSRITPEWEIIVVDDGSYDRTYEEIRKVCRMEPRVRAIRLSRNFGKEGALLAGLRHASGDAAITIDSDLQHPPEVIPRLVEEWRRGALVVHAFKLNRGKDHWITRARAALFNATLSILSGMDMMNASDFKLLDRIVIDSIVDEIRERRRFYRGLTQWVGYKQASVGFEVEPRTAGKGKWLLRDLLSLAVTGVVSFSSMPLRIVTILGLIMILFGVVIAIDALISYFRGLAVSGFATLIITNIFIGSIVMISLGVIGEYIAKIYEEVKKRPPYLIASRMNFSARSTDGRGEAPDAEEGR